MGGRARKVAEHGAVRAATFATFRMDRTPITYRATGRFAPIVLDYIDGAETLRPFVQWPFTLEGLEQAAAARRFDPVSRVVLCAALERQYAGSVIDPAVRVNLDRLRDPSTLTITTGHQLCLFTGPLYFHYKILNAIRLARDLSRGDRAVVPVFWMATEDHDRAEIDHTWVFGKEVKWPGEAGGPVGRMKLDGIEAVLQELDALLGAGDHAAALRAMIYEAYRPGQTLAQATRSFVNALFGRFGILIIDGDDPDLKRLFAPVMKEELLNQVVQRTVNYAEEQMGGRYPAQAHAREVNLFHMADGLRARIELRDDKYHVLDGGTAYTAEELLDTLEDRPQVFSPNVLLRPLYQETVLPNIAYVGGGGELAYWLQLRWLFQAFQTPMPVLVLRTSALLVGMKEQERLKGLGLAGTDLFAPIDAVRERLARSRTTIDVDLSRERVDITALFDRLALRVKEVDPTLEATVQGGAQKTLKSIEAVEQKLVRAAKQEQEVSLQRLDKVYSALFPGGGLQERRDNFAPFFLQQGPSFFDALLNALDPLDKEFSVLELDQ